MNTLGEVVEHLRREAMDDPAAGWLSDMSPHGLTWDAEAQAIQVHGADEWPIGSIDVGRLAEIFADMPRGSDEPMPESTSLRESLARVLFASDYSPHNAATWKVVGWRYLANADALIASGLVGPPAPGAHQIVSTSPSVCSCGWTGDWRAGHKHIRETRRSA